jgi:hypothetical protein
MQAQELKESEHRPQPGQDVPFALAAMQAQLQRLEKIVEELAVRATASKPPDVEYAAPPPRRAMEPPAIYRRSAPLPTFSGARSAPGISLSDELHEWLAALEQQAALERWSEDDKLLNLQSLCTHAARDTLAVAGSSARTYTDAKQMLLRTFASAAPPAAQALKARIALMEMRQQQDEPVDEFAARFRAACARLHRIGEPVAERDRIAILISAALPQLQIAASLPGFADLSFEQVVESMRVEELRLELHRLELQRLAPPAPRRNFWRPSASEPAPNQAAAAPPQDTSTTEPPPAGQNAPRQNQHSKQERNRKFKLGKEPDEPPQASKRDQPKAAAPHARALLALSPQVDQQAPYVATLRIFNRDLRALVDTGATCSILSKCAFGALHLTDDAYARHVREPVQAKVIDTLNGRITPIASLQARGSVHIGGTAATLSRPVQFLIVESIPQADALLGLDALSQLGMTLVERPGDHHPSRPSQVDDTARTAPRQ